ncbi:phosphate ABC transporter permease PstA [Thioalkalivibrio sp. XN279]|uniref:phosphate ABC transporter permease PstA n=1 Tax=Thioalkalivibrio sp. XN279 TaxID=2714953 RepID=UPI00351B7A7F
MNSTNNAGGEGRSPVLEVVRASLPRRYRAEARFKAYGIIALVLALSFLGLLLTSIISNGYTAFQQTYMQLEFNLDAEVVDPDGDGSEASLRAGNYLAVVRNSLYDLFPEVTSRSERRALSSLVSTGAMYQLQNMVLADPSLVGQTIQMWVPADDDVDMYRKGRISADVPEGERRLSDKQLGWIDAMAARDRLELKFNTALFTNGDSRDPELAGILGALKGSFYMLLVTLILSFPIGIAAAVYLEEFAPKNRWTDLIEVNINNLAAVPSIVFGLLGLAVFLNYFGMPRSAPLVGGLVLSLMTLPTIIIASRAALKAVPPSIREAALGMGASKMQTTFHHVVPLAMPGMLTGTIIGMAQALGETAPLLMIGMVAFIVDVPQGFTDPSTALPVQIFLWADSPERAFVERTSAAIIVLLGFLLVMNLLAVFLRRKFERRW